MKYQVNWTGHFDYPDVCIIDATTGYVVNRVNRCRTIAATIREAQILADILNAVREGKESSAILKADCVVSSESLHEPMTI